jgi:glycosyltransferase involved in cell wall biosynthesis
MTVRRIPNGDVGAARNMGLGLARGRVLTFLDSDDRWRPHKLTLEREILRSEPEVGLTFSNFERFTSGGRWETDQFAFYPLLPDIPTRPSASGQGRVMMTPAFLSVIPFYDFPAFCQVIAVRREVVGDIRFPNRSWDAKGRLSFLEDLGFVPRLFRRTTVAYIPEPLADVRRHDSNSTKDYERMGYSILNTLMSLRDESLTAAEGEALEARIARQEISVGHQRVLDGEPGKALKAYWRGARAGRPHSAVKGLLSLPFARFR